ncbi:YjgN family protein [Prosthecomicrobium sp. N25]|uniref:YjgN family protein n=1 Tax=Prosthecomicrobium sp. N25 TaxID=3129254 RepID=UPI003077C487
MTDIPFDDRFAAAAPAAPRAETPRLGTGAVRAYYDATSPGIMRLAFLGGLFSILTLGIYRFWYITDLRRQLWRRSALGGSNFEYTGTAKEIFIGFLIMLAILAPLYLLSFLAQLDVGGVFGTIANLVFIFGLFFFIGFAMFRARRYRLTRTLWRGVRFGQTGSAAAYALRAMGWGFLTMLTATLAFPFYRASQERYRVNNTWYGDRKFECRASGLAMLLPWILFIAAAVLPLVFAVVHVLSIAPIDTLAGYIQTTAGADGMPKLTLGPNAPAALTAAIGVAIGAAVWLFVAPILLWPVYRAREIRSFMGRTSLGGTTFRSDFSALSIYGSYLLFMLVAALTFAGLAAVTAGVLAAVGGFDDMSPAGIVAFAGVYLVAVWLIGTLKTRLVTAALWGKVVTSVVVDGIEHLSGIGARRDQASGVGDDFASSYDFGAI